MKAFVFFPLALHVCLSNYYHVFDKSKRRNRFKIQAAKLIVQVLMQKYMHVFNLLLSYSDYEELQVGGGECPVTLYTFIYDKSNQPATNNSIHVY